MKELLVSILERFCPDSVFLQGTLNSDETYPQKLITFFVTDSPFDDFYDNEANKINWYVYVYFYSDNPREVLDMPPQIIRALKENGFIPRGAGIDLLSDVKTHTGWAMEFIYRENYTN